MFFVQNRGDKQMGPYVKKFIKIFFITAMIGTLLVIGAFAGAVLGFMGSVDGIDVSELTLDSTTHIYYTDRNGEEKLLAALDSEQNRVWVDYDKIPQAMKDAFVSIEDERFYQHSGVDVKRTAKATFMYFVNKITRRPTSFGGSSITQQLVKNLTNEKDQSPIRKMQEISRSVNLEKELSKDQILELYLNSIYLSQGCNGVQTASQTYFGKDVSELNLAECASIAGITQYPSLYDPLVNPDKNKEKQKTVLSKMLELGKITQSEFDDALAFQLDFKRMEKDEETNKINSYFVDQVIYDVINALMDKGYSRTMANKMLYSGGLKIVSTCDADIQNAIENVYEQESNFYSSSASPSPQSAMLILDPYTGAVKGMAGGIGKKTANLTLNRATQTLRQPGSSIKPIAVYAPAIENNLITPVDIYNDKATSYGGWTPQNVDRQFRGPVSVQYAVQQSLNTVAVEILDKLGTKKSFDFLTNNLGITSLIEEEVRADGKSYSDIGLSQLALGGLTDGVSVLQMAAAYAPFANNGIYTEPHTYTKVLNAEGKEIITNEPESHIAMDASTAYVTTRMLRNVVTSGTGGGAQVSSGIFTAGKTGTATDYRDRWFIGYTPYYVGAVWYGYDQPKSTPSSPCVRVWKKVMDQVHKGLPDKMFDMPSQVVSASYCKDSGKAPSDACREAGTVQSFYFVKGSTPRGTCNLPHTPEAGENPEDANDPNASNNPENPEASPDVSPDASGTPAPSPSLPPNTTPVQQVSDSAPSAAGENNSVS